jgi:DNA-binding protein H-NS
MQLRSMSLDRLIGLREKVEAALNERIAGERSELESRLKELSDFGGTEKAARRGPRGRVPPKYRNPENLTETWTGRGLPPRWLAAALKKRGRRLEDFLIEEGSTRRRKATAKAGKAKASRKRVRSRKAAKAREAAKPPKAAKRRNAAKPLKAKIVRRPRVAPQAPTPTLTDQSGGPTPAA